MAPRKPRVDLQQKKYQEDVAARIEQDRSNVQFYKSVNDIIKTYDTNIQTNYGIYNAKTIKQVIESHNNGMFQQSAIFIETELMSDPKISNALSLVESIILDTWTPENIQFTADTDESKSALTWFQRNLFTIFDETAITSVFEDQWMNGFAIQQLNYEGNFIEDGPRLSRWHPGLVQYLIPSRHFALITQNQTTELQGLEEIESNEKWQIFSNSNNTNGHYRCWMKAGWKTLADIYLKKKFSALDWSRFSELYGNPTKLLHMPAEASEPEKQAFIFAVKSLTTEGVIPLLTDNEGKKLWDMSFLQPQAHSSDIMKELIEYCDNAIDIAILGTSKVVEGEVGPYNFLQNILTSVLGAKPRLYLRYLEKDINVCLKNIASAIFGDVKFAPTIKINFINNGITMANKNDLNQVPKDSDNDKTSSNPTL
jgi:hypothetical protein